MTWTAFWAPNLVQWIVGGAISAVVAAVVGFLVRRWLRDIADQLFGEQQRTAVAAEAAATQSTQAATQAVRAAGQATEATAASQQATEALVFMADQLGQSRAAQDWMARRNDDMLAANLELIAMLRQQSTPTPPLTGPVPVVAVPPDDPTLTITGRHRLYTQSIPTIDEGDHS